MPHRPSYARLGSRVNGVQKPAVNRVLKDRLGEFTRAKARGLRPSQRFRGVTYCRSLGFLSDPGVFRDLFLSGAMRYSGS